MKVRKKPVEVDAWPVRDLCDAGNNNWKSLPEAILEAYDRGEILFLLHPRRLRIQTIEGWMDGNIDDYIICGVQRELYPIKPDIFAETYEVLP